MTHPRDLLNESPSQTAGPYVHIGCVPNQAGIAIYNGTDLGAAMISGPVAGQQITLDGIIYDGDGTPLYDAMIELWQADANGYFASLNDTRGRPDPNFRGWGRSTADRETGQYRFETVKPGQVPGPNGQMQAPHITMWIAARGINTGLHTRVYFADEPTANAEDPLLQSITDTARLPTLMAQQVSPGHYRFDVHLQGAAETVFLDI